MILFYFSCTDVLTIPWNKLTAQIPKAVRQLGDQENLFTVPFFDDLFAQRSLVRMAAVSLIVSSWSQTV